MNGETMPEALEPDVAMEARTAAEALSAQPLAAKQDVVERNVQAAKPWVGPRSVRIEGDAAAVIGPLGLSGDGGEVTKLRLRSARATTLILDFGRVVMGEIELGVRAARGAPIRAAYAQFQQFLGPDGDGMGAPFGTDAHPWSRVDVFEPPDGPRELKSPGKRELRYLALTLDGAGEVELDFVRVRQTTYPVRYDGHFLSSDELLNRAWYASAYTGDLATVTEAGSQWMLTVTFDRVLFMADLHLQAIAGYYQSSDYLWLMRNTLARFGPIQNPDGSFPCASSHLVRGRASYEAPPTGWQVPEDGPEPNSALGFAAGYSLFNDIKIDSFTAFWVASLADYHLYSGDEDFVRLQLPVARRAIDFLRGRMTEEGLYFEPPDQRTDASAKAPWVANWSPGDRASGVDAFSNAVVHAALNGLARLEEDVAGRIDEARALRRQAQELRRALMARLWDGTVGAMILNAEDPLRDHTGDANAGNLMLRTLDAEQARQAMRFLETTLATPFGTRSSEYEGNPYRASNIQGYINAMEALGRVRNGDGEGAVKLIRRWWGHMLDHGPGTGWFSWNNDGSVERGAFANTAWTTALPALSEGILGVRPLTPGFRRWEVAPQPSGLTWAKGSVPTPAGSLAVRWQRTEASFVLTVEAPESTEGDVVVPLVGPAHTIAMDGETVWSKDRAPEGVSAERRGKAVVFSSLRGSHTFASG